MTSIRMAPNKHISTSFSKFLPRSHLPLRLHTPICTPPPPASIISNTLSYSSSLSVSLSCSNFDTSNHHLRARPARQSTVPGVRKARKRRRAERENQIRGEVQEVRVREEKRDRREKMSRKRKNEGKVQREVRREERRRKVRDGSRGKKEKKGPLPNKPLFMSLAAESAAARLLKSESMGETPGEAEMKLSNVDEFVAIFFSWGLLKSDILHLPPPPPLSNAPPHDITRLANILQTWMFVDPIPSFIGCKTNGHTLGKQLLHVCMDKGLSEKSLWDLVRDIAQYYREFLQDCEDEAGKSAVQRGEGMGRLLRLVWECEEGGHGKGKGFPGWGRLISDAKLLFALLHGVTEEIGKVMEAAEKSGI